MPTQKQVNYVYVVDANGTPVMPTSRLGMVRRWLKSGQAIWYGNSRTTIQFVRPIDTQTQPLTLGINTGFHLGMSVVGNDREYYASESIRKTEKDRITARREYRQTRFDNRRRKAGWLAPSVQHRLEFTVREIQRLYRFLPISQLVVEVSPFDNQKLANPDIKPWQYTQGKMHGYQTVKDYLLARDHNRDALDGKAYPASQLRVHHLVQRKDGGTNQPDNLVLLSDVHHNQANHVNGTLAKMAANRQRTIDYRGVYFMSLLASCLNRYFPDYVQTQGYLTANLRTRYGIAKSYLNDAFVIAGGTDQYTRTGNVYRREKLRCNNRSLQKFYDAKYIDRRDDKKKAGKELSSGRTKRSRELNYDNQRIYRLRKVSKGRISIRRQHYRLRPHDIVFNTKIKQIEFVKGVNGNGKNVLLQSGHNVTPRKLICLYHVNGILTAKVPMVLK